MRCYDVIPLRVLKRIINYACFGFIEDVTSKFSE